MYDILCTHICTIIIQGLSDGSATKGSAYNVGDREDVDLIAGSRRSPAGRSGNPLQYSCLENPMDRGLRRATVHGVTKSNMTEWLSMHIYNICIYIYTHSSFICIYMCVCKVAQSCLTLCNPVDCSLPDSSVYGILLVRIPEWITVSFSRIYLYI